ncbi:hypothetical protein DV515_00007302 [Chloebia gouldiae]|uniref:TLX1 protein n=1 Tax=Chloebia gouldiae TaxID=44316 RepID=A0A3L8SHE1_CHLGU|nr:hypothetical protein DV515_00007302 [Chloebia gouldiae]
MEHLGAHHLHQGQAEPISFGIDQILNTSEPGSCMVSHPRLQDSADYGLGCIVGSAYNTVTGGYGASGGAAGAYTGTSCSMGGLPGSYNVNMAVNMNGNTLSSAGGVIRVPAHRPVAGGVHQPLSAAVPAVNGMNSLTGLTFPWMESNRRYTKDRFTGELCHRDPLSVSAPAAPLPPPPPGLGAHRGRIQPGISPAAWTTQPRWSWEVGPVAGQKQDGVGNEAYPVPLK